LKHIQALPQAERDQSMLNKIPSAKTKSTPREMPLDIRLERIELNQLTPDILKSIPYGIIAFDAKGKIIADNNKHWLINAKASNWSPKDVFKLAPDNSFVTLLNDFINQPAIKETGVEVKIKELLVGKSFEMILPKCQNTLNKSVVLHLTGVPLINSSGNIIGGLLVIDDVSRYFKAGNRISTQMQLYEPRLNDFANTQVVLDNENKIVATNPVFQKEIEKLNILQELVKGIGKELRNPLSIIKKSASFLDFEFNKSTQFRSALDIQHSYEEECNLQVTNKIRRSLSIIIQEIDACNKLINDLIEFVQTPPPEKTKVTLREAIDDALQFLTVSIPPTVKVIIDFPKILPCLDVDRHQIKQALANVITHSVAGMLSGGKLIFSARMEGASLGSRSQKNLVLTVSDTGIGIPNQKHPKLFHSLFTRKTHGIDLGLVVARYLVKTNGGAINMKCIPGIGTTFLISLPMFHDAVLKLQI
jgi:nitrogen-specific signal transduction histidine kinase